MSSIITDAIIKHKRGLAADWTSENPVLEEAEWGKETDTPKAKIGDGSTLWNDLAYFGSVGSPIGTMTEWGGNDDLSDIPIGYLACDGSEVLRATYPELNTLMSNAGYPWGDGDGSTTFNLPKGAFDSGWLSTSTWTAGNSITINHGMKKAFDEFDGQIWVRQDSAPDKLYNVTNIETLFASNTFGQRLNGIDGDLDNCFLQIRDSNAGAYLNDAGTLIAVPTSAWSYKVILRQKAMSARTIIKAQ